MHLYGLIGYPLGHSFSKKYFSDKFEKEKLDACRFELFPLESITAFPALIAKESELLGLAVTIPYKEVVIPYLNFLDDVTRAAGAVNCIKISGNISTGFNTDVTGFKKTIVPLLKVNHTKALILGTGGASKAVQYVLKELQIPFLLVTRKKITAPGFINYEMIDENIITEYPLIINCTPAGMWPDEQHEPSIPYHFLNNKNLLYDLIYTPAHTRFLQHGQERGAIIKNGYEMLIIQAEENWRIWNEP